MSNSTIGWQAGPAERDTLTLVYGCLITIFTCTWTVLHLNVPGLSDKWWEIAMRKAKWMAITVLLPEFIFAKAVCDLRLALKNLHDFEIALKEKHKDSLQWTDSYEYIGHTYSWQVDYGPRAKRLYKILGLTPPDDQSRPIESIMKYEGNDLAARSSSDAEEAQADRNTTRNYHTTQLWTLTHAYLADMGGLVYYTKKDFWENNRLEYYVLTGATLSLAHSWNPDHPLRGLVLGKGDIEDKSKADWLLKFLAILQVTWLVLTVIVRGASSLPVTQLEIATVAFSVSAIATYAANWWKPKDVSQPIRIPRIADGDFELDEVDILALSFTRRLTDFAMAKDDVEKTRAYQQQRVKNDVTWIQGGVPLIYNIMAAFSVVFGGIHLIAWNFEFPSLAELMLWRASSLMSTILPLIIIMPNLYLNYLATTYTDNKLKSSFYEIMKTLYKPPADFQDTLKRLHSSLGDENERNTPPTRTSSSTFNERPLNNEEDNFNKSRLRALTHKLLTFFTLWESSKETFAQKDYSTLKARQCLAWILIRASDKALETYENFCYNNSITPDTWIPIKHHIRLILDIFKRYEEEEDRIQTQKEAYTRVSKFLTIGGSILYIISRLIILVLLFTSLRAVPKGVYDDTPWTRFLPSFS
ncbi:hypothetical protein FHL15_005437 [Xylaria flabelliformis]|uniref:Transmembrane protein n=1 Tax=Xylaria flabelliformis TaxID=2512241 RepID=A0A553I0Q3_9PEZI|nr:hypothetical protein FHL15_005437 [Xylaria flabelliformis]